MDFYQQLVLERLSLDPCVYLCLYQLSRRDTISLWPQQNLWNTRAPHITEKIETHKEI